ncbi:hypothetical protein LTR02_009601 [Friedmanniomyces endolithicus]|uniref:Uncharacterized protein n=1 Tax=Rachicladosporium monterosium TaxID=1507873 RepID=A0ABR0L0D5_9PEZI|nr:hypothetical protein LTR02_009601 [Friedmanniomyces endolithicus]KAK5141533.1 hypothetical protein LTR32_005927 [Rachicladosporium monterosium]KAK0933334.1 hypothetical protein LTR29_015085 [Friedmanniomyces endolithicus]KAK0998785.1 hypothetical protein LTS01_005612 [Friedmanniomyces endolithicus]KAK1040892.1 putative secondary metabolism biosynthetic enzyme [Friedmanniomyces endolithicus]
MSTGKTITLITGANSGIGFELAAQLLAKGTHHVLLGSRSPSKGRAALQRLQALESPGTASLIHLDVTDDTTIAAAVAQIETEHGHLDILVNNAAIGRAGETDTRKAMRECFDTNATGPAMLGYAFEELLGKSRDPMRRIVNVSSGAGSVGRMFDPNRRAVTGLGRTVRTRPSPFPLLVGLTRFDADDILQIPYQASKAALSMVSAQQSLDFAPHGVKVLCWNPGFTVSDLGPFNKVEHGAKPVEVAVRPLVEILEGKRDAEANVFLSEDGGKYPW